MFSWWLDLKDPKVIVIDFNFILIAIIFKWYLYIANWLYLEYINKYILVE